MDISGSDLGVCWECCGHEDDWPGTAAVLQAQACPWLASECLQVRGKGCLEDAASSLVQCQHDAQPNDGHGSWATYYDGPQHDHEPGSGDGQ